MSSARGQATGRRRQRIAEVIGARLETLTRFRAADLKELSPDTESAAELVVTTRQRIDLDIETGLHSGRLPPGIAPCPDAAALDTAGQQRLVSAESATAVRIQHWATEEPGRYRRLLPDQGLFGDTLGEPIGAEWACATCGQRGRIACAGCAGSGTRTCPDCRGRQHGPCRDCRGLGRLACAACEGRGQVVRAGTPAEPEAMVPCAVCQQGWLNCTACDGQGERDCSRCTASGRVPCPDCQGQQTLDCPDCATTGWQHRQSRLRERRTVEDLLEVQHADPAVAAAIMARFSEVPEVAALGDVCTLEQVRYTTAPLAVQAVQRLKLVVRQANLLVAGQPMPFTALGPALAVIDFRQVAAVLMTPDLVTLEKNAAGSGRHLGEALQRFLQSPLNREIAWQTPTAEIERQHPGLVDAAYQARAVQAVQHAIERLWRQQVWRPTLACLGGVGIVAALGVALGSGRLGMGMLGTVLLAAALAVGLGVIAWGVAEWRVRHHLGSALQIAEGERRLQPLRQSGSVRRWQVQSLAAAAVVALAGAAAMTRLPHVRQHAEQTRAATALAQQLDAWLVSEGKDYRLRHYPDADTLQQQLRQAGERAAPADPRLRLVRAWQLLLGPDGVAPDPRSAEHLLDGLADDPRLGSAAVIGQARAALLLRGRSTAALQAAATSLEALPEPAPPEALYTLALIQLAPALTPRAGPAPPGLATLQQAADLGHASACFELGRRLAGGGASMKRDVAAARRYLAYAEAKGVPGAAQALENLR
jgi:hypothetical protein